MNIHTGDARGGRTLTREEVLQQTFSTFPYQDLPPEIIEYGMFFLTSFGVPLAFSISFVISIISVACLALIDVRAPYKSSSEHCGIFYFGLAPSGGGKTTISEPLTHIFDGFFSIMDGEYRQKIKDYKKKHRIWKERERALCKCYNEAIRNNLSGEAEELALEQHLEQELEKPMNLRFMFTDITEKALIQGFNANPFEIGALVGDEGIGFLQGSLKGRPTILNKGWDGGLYNHDRLDECLTFSPRMAISLMAQPTVFHSYLKNNLAVMRESGLLSRFLLVEMGHQENQQSDNGSQNQQQHSLKGVTDKLQGLLEEVKLKFNAGDTDREVFTLDAEAEYVLDHWRKYIAPGIEPDGSWYHIEDFVRKSSSNILRIAAVLHKFKGGSIPQLSYDDINSAAKVVDWHIKHTSIIFEEDSVGAQFIKDVQEVAAWLIKRFQANGNSPVLKSQLLTSGPRRLRSKEKLDPILTQLVCQQLIAVVKGYGNNNSTYIAWIRENGRPYLPGVSYIHLANIRHVIIFRPIPPEKYINIDLPDS